jgi:putative inner-membrane translocator
MNHNDIRKGILQAKMIEDTSGLLFAEVLLVPVLLAFTVCRLEFVKQAGWSDFALFTTGFGTLALFLWCYFHETARFWLAVFFSCIWAYAVWKFVHFIGNDRPASDYISIGSYLSTQAILAIPSIIVFLLTMLFHFCDFKWMDDVSN